MTHPQDVPAPSPTVSDAMREAMTLAERILVRGPPCSWNCKDSILAFETIASALAALERENATLRAEQKRIDHNCQEWVRQAGENAEAADKLARKVDTLRTSAERMEAARDAESEAANDALKAASYLISRLRACHEGKPVRDLPEAEAAYCSELRRMVDTARAALNPKETPDA